MRTLIASMFLVMVCGCQNMQQQKSNDPNAVVGRVIALEPRGLPFAAVGDVQPSEFHVGDTVTFMDKNRNVLTTGVVRRITDSAVHVEWAKTGRAPQLGDLAGIHQTHRTMMQSSAPADTMTAAPTTQNSP